MHLFKFGFLSFSALFLLPSGSFAKPTTFSLASRHNLQNEVSSIAGSKLLRTRSNSKAHRQSRASDLSPLPESDRARSLMILGRRDLSQLKQILRTYFDHFVPFDPSSLPQAFPALNAMITKMQSMVANLDPGQQLNGAWTFTYGAFQMTIRGTGQAVEVIQEVIEYIREKIIGGMIGFFQANIISIAGATIVLTYGLILAAIIWFAQIPNNGPLDPQEAVGWMRYGG